MEAITIEPVNNSIKLMLEALKIKNEFIKMGFRSGPAIGAILKYSFPELSEKYSEMELVGYWNMRIRNEEMNNDFVKVIETLKVE